METTIKPVGGNLPKCLSGESNLKTVEDFASLCESEFQVKRNNLISEYTEKNNWLANIRDRQVKEYKFMHSIMEFNTNQIEDKVNPAQIIEIEKSLAELNYETVAASFCLEHWRVQFGESMIVPVLCDIMSYFLNQFEVKEKLSDAQIMQLACKLLAAQPKLRVMELVFVLQKALAGDYGPTYQRIGIDTLLTWLKKFYEDSAIYLENKVANGRMHESRGEVPWEKVARDLKAYEDEQRKKKMIVDKVWNTAKQVREKEERLEQVKQYKDQVLNDGESK